LPKEEALCAGGMTSLQDRQQCSLPVRLGTGGVGGERCRGDRGQMILIVWFKAFSVHPEDSRSPKRVLSQKVTSISSRNLP
jgi:hypothetical protein